MMTNNKKIETGVVVSVIIFLLVLLFTVENKERVLQTKVYHYRGHMDLHKDTTITEGEKVYYEYLYSKTKY